MFQNIRGYFIQKIHGIKFFFKTYSSYLKHAFPVANFVLALVTERGEESLPV